jgi:hypothetical protein
MNHLTISVSSLREAHLVDQAVLSLRHSSTVHIKIDTGWVGLVCVMTKHVKPARY